MKKSAIYELLHAVQEMEASHLLFRRRLERRGRRWLDGGALMSKMLQIVAGAHRLPEDVDALELESVVALRWHRGPQRRASRSVTGEHAIRR
jgi:hypothetical protein